MAFNGRLSHSLIRLEINYFSSNFIPPAIDDKGNVATLYILFYNKIDIEFESIISSCYRITNRIFSISWNNIRSTVYVTTAFTIIRYECMIKNVLTLTNTLWLGVL